MKSVIVLLTCLLALSASSLYALEAGEARKKLAEMGVEYTIDAFADSIRKGDATVVNLFLDAGMDVNKADSTGRPPLVIAAGVAPERQKVPVIEKRR